MVFIATLPPVTTIPLLAVTSPMASTLVTSSYVNVPAIDTLPWKVAIPVTSKSPVVIFS